MIADNIETLPKIAYQLAVERARQVAGKARRRAFWAFWAPERHLFEAQTYEKLADRLEAHARTLGVGSRRHREPVSPQAGAALPFVAD